MSRLVRCVILLSLVASTGCCATPYRRFQDAYGFNNPVPQWYGGGPKPPVTTPPGPTTPAKVPVPPSVRS